MKLLAFSDLHRDLRRAARLVERAAEADVVVGAGDFASVHRGLEETIAALAAIATPTVLVPGNNETDEALRAAVDDDWPAACVLHGEAAERAGTTFFGLGAGVPTTPWDWSYDLDEPAAARLLEALPSDAVLVSHSPPYGHVDESNGRHLGSRAVLEAIVRRAPRLVLCGHIHEAWGGQSAIGATPVRNLGPDGALLDV